MKQVRIATKKMDRSLREQLKLRATASGFAAHTALRMTLHQRLWLRCLLSAEWSERPPPARLPPMPWSLSVQLKALLLARGLRRNNFLFMERAAELSDALHRHFAERCEPAVDEPLPVVDYGVTPPEEIREKFWDACHPVVIRGLGLDTERWSAAALLDQYGDVPVLLDSPSQRITYKAPLAELATSTEERPLYIHNCEKLFVDYPEMLDHLGHQRLESCGQFGMTTAQLFFGLTKGTGTPFHCAPNYNFFFQLSGRKRWTFVHPAFTPLMYPAVSGRLGYATSAVGLPAKGEDTRDLPLYEYCPRYVAELEPGDVLLNPPWWYHAIENLTDETVAVATRWGGGALYNRHVVAMNPLYSGLSFWGSLPTMIDEVTEIVASGPQTPGASTLTEEGDTSFEAFSHDQLLLEARSGALRKAWGLAEGSSRSRPGRAQASDDGSRRARAEVGV